MKITITVDAAENEFSYVTLASRKMIVIADYPATIGVGDAVTEIVLDVTVDAQGVLDAESAETDED